MCVFWWYAVFNVMCYKTSYIYSYYYRMVTYYVKILYIPSAPTLLRLSTTYIFMYFKLWRLWLSFGMCELVLILPPFKFLCINPVCFSSLRMVKWLAETCRRSISIVNQPDAQYFKFILFWNSALHVLDGFSGHHQESKTAHTASYHTCPVAAC